MSTLETVFMGNLQRLLLSLTELVLLRLRWRLLVAELGRLLIRSEHVWPVEEDAGVLANRLANEGAVLIQCL